MVDAFRIMETEICCGGIWRLARLVKLSEILAFFEVEGQPYFISNFTRVLLYPMSQLQFWVSELFTIIFILHTSEPA